MTRSWSLFEAVEFRLEDDDSQLLLNTLNGAYRSKPEIRALLKRTPIRDTEIDTDGSVKEMWIAVLDYAAQKGHLRKLVEAAVNDPGTARHHGSLSQLLAREQATVPPVLDPSPANEANILLRDVERSHAPIIIALETAAEPLTEAELARTACHLVVTLSQDQVDEVGPEARRALAESSSVADLVAAGGLVWQRLCAAEPRLTTLHTRIVGEGVAQPVGWHGRPALLDALAEAIQIAHTGQEGPRGFLSVGAGAHYFSPVHDPGERSARTIKRRRENTDPLVDRVDLRIVHPDHVRAELGPVDSDVVIAVNSANPRVLTELGEAVRTEVVRPTRAVLAFGGRADVREIDALLDVVPFVSCAAVRLAEDATLDLLKTVVERHAAHVAMPCLVAAVRAASVGSALERDDVVAARRALAWSMWSWIGLPLFSRSYHPVKPALYPHLMDLRSIATRDWYFDRGDEIGKDYQAGALVRANRPEDRFHLYLSGAGGTGKSCFLSHVRDELRDRDASLAVWYRVDAPSSEWGEVARRIREETVRTIADYLDDRLANAVDRIRGGLAKFLTEAAALLRERVAGFDEIVVFVDQLERTFESGDAPDAVRLKTISKEVVDLLTAVGIDNGVRIFVASRKQYLPDFLTSSRKAAGCHLEFNVLQAISDEDARVAFIRRVVNWCSAEQLIGRNVRLAEDKVDTADDAARALARNLDGNPLNMMLALIQLLSQNFTGVITAEDVRRRKPWNELFQFDLAAAERDELDLYFLLAMSHARTEIVRFEEVWWRIRMVSPQLTRRVTDLESHGVRERLWLLGFLGRTIYARPGGGEPMRYVEFFHANLRDYLLRERMSPGGDLRGGTPPAWRALDRLSGFAHDWAQILQPLLAEEIRVLMEHKDEVIATGLIPDDNSAPPFHLLFLRDPADARAQLSTAAMACFAYSALVHDEGGRWAVQTLFPDLKDAVNQCHDWLLRSPAELLPPILRYLVPLEAEPARALLVELLLNSGHPRSAETTRATAVVLAEPLYAARWRNDVLLTLLTAALRQVGGDPDRLGEPVVGLVVAACERDRDALLALIKHCVQRLEVSEDANLSMLAPRLKAFGGGVDRWLGQTSSSPLLGGAFLPDTAEVADAPLQLVLGSALRGVVTDATLTDWSAAVRAALADMPLPDIAPTDGDVEPDEIELRLSGQRVARGVFRPELRRVPKRLWNLANGSPVAEDEDVQSEEDVLWLSADVIEAAGYRFEHLDFDTAAVRWIVDRCRSGFGLLFDADLQVDFLNEVATSRAGRDCLRRAGSRLVRAVFADLIVEGVPVASRDAVLEQLTDIVPRVEQRDAATQREAATQKVREFLGTEICQSIADESGQVTTILLDDHVERALLDRIDQGRPLSPAEAIRLNAAIRRLAHRTAEWTAGPPPAIVTVSRLRRMLAVLLNRLGHRLPVLSFPEWNESFIDVPGGLIAIDLDPETEPVVEAEP